MEKARRHCVTTTPMGIRVPLSRRLVRSTGLMALMLLAATSLSSPASAYLMWQGGVSSDFTDSNNWQNGLVPVPGVHFDIGIGATVPTIGSGQNVSLAGSWVGVSQNAGLRIENGGIFSNYLTYINGDVHVQGNGSLLATDTLDVLLGGSLTISAGGVVTSDSIIRLSDGGPNSPADVMITGNGSVLSTNGYMYVAISDRTNLTVSDGALLSSDTAIIGEFYDALGNVLITGNGSRWINAGAFEVGSGWYTYSSGMGIVTIADGGLVETATALIGLNGQSVGTIHVTGAGSRFVDHGALVVGQAGSGALILSDGGRAEIGAGTIRVADLAGSAGSVNIGAAAGGVATAPGFTDVSTVVFGDGDGRVVFNHTDVTGNYEFTPAISGAGSVDIYSGTTILSAANSFTGATTVYGGTLLANGADTFNSASMHDIRAGGTLRLAGYDQTLSAMFNGGTVITGGAPGTRLTVHDYVGSGGTVVLSTLLGGDGSPSDRLVITGTATGHSLLSIVNAGGTGALTGGDGILVVEAINGGSTAAESFRLGGRVAEGGYEYLLHRGGMSGSDNWYLRSTEVIADPETPGGTIEVPNIRSEVPLMAAATSIAMEYGYAMLGTLHERVGEVWIAPAVPSHEERVVRDRNGRRELVRVPAGNADRQRWFSGAWARVIGDRGFQDRNNLLSGGPGYDYTFAGIQAGLDIFARERSDGTLDKAGIYAGYGSIDADVKGAWQGKAGSIGMDVYTVGAYWTHFAPSGWYTDAVVQGSWYQADAKSVMGQQLKPDGFGFLASLEGGYAFKLGGGFTFEPQAQLVYQNVSFDDVSDAYGRFELGSGESVRGRIGARLGKTVNMGDEASPRLLKTWLRANLWHEFAGDAKTRIADITVNASLGGTWAEIGAGVSGQVSEKVTLFATGAYNRSLDNRGREAWNGRLGVNVTW